ncbi:MAG: Cof-type HAD-IIB family hydrolase [Oscillospiraceae bacterium]|nr:Cof-type HAD-IIB family hydrolase [Oscillospiraceae bacterium]
MRYDIRLLVTDLDGTLIADGDAFSEEDLRALQAVYDRGISMAICSGRDARFISDIALNAGLEECAILALNGAYVLDRPDGDVLEDHRISPLAAKACLDALLNQTGELVMYQGETVLTYRTPQFRRMLRGSPRAGVDTNDGTREAMYEMAASGAHKMVYSELDHPERLRPLRKKLSMIPGIDITSSWFTNIEIMPSGIHKGYAVSQLADRLGIRLDQVMAFGDNDNDASMLAAVGYGVAMGNAADAARSAARYTTDSNTHNGVAKGIERFILIDDFAKPSISA